MTKCPRISHTWVDQKASQAIESKSSSGFDLRFSSVNRASLCGLSEILNVTIIYKSNIDIPASLDCWNHPQLLSGSSSVSFLIDSSLASLLSFWINSTFTAFPPSIHEAFKFSYVRRVCYQLAEIFPIWKLTHTHYPHENNQQFSSFCVNARQTKQNNRIHCRESCKIFLRHDTANRFCVTATRSFGFRADNYGGALGTAFIIDLIAALH